MERESAEDSRSNRFRVNHFGQVVLQLSAFSIALALTSCASNPSKPGITHQSAGTAEGNAAISGLGLRPFSREDVLKVIIGNDIEATSFPVAARTGDGPEHFSADGSYQRRADRVQVFGKFSLADSKLCISVRYAARDDCRVFYYATDGRILMEYVGRNPRAFSIISIK